MDRWWLVAMLVASLVVNLESAKNGTSKRYIAKAMIGDQDLPLRDVGTRYFVPDGACSGILTDMELGCDGNPPETLWIHTTDTVKTPLLKISDDLTQVIVRRRHSDSPDDPCPGRLWLKLRVACDGPLRLRDCDADGPLRVRRSDTRKDREQMMKPAPSCNTLVDCMDT